MSDRERFDIPVVVFIFKRLRDWQKYDLKSCTSSPTRGATMLNEAQQQR